MQTGENQAFVLLREKRLNGCNDLTKVQGVKCPAVGHRENVRSLR